MGTLNTGSILVTGAAGFTGRHLLSSLHALGQEVTGVSLRSQEGLYACNLTRRSDVQSLLATVQPRQIYHCAGTFANAWDVDLPANALSSHYLLDVAAELGLSCRILLIGSAAEYGSPSPGPVPETAPLRAVSIYGLTKVLQTQIMEYFHRRHGVDVVMARTFNLFGQGCSPALFPGRVQDQIVRLQAGAIDTITVGPIDSRRDYLPVEEAVRAYVRIMRHGVSGEIYNVGSGVATRLADLLSTMLTDHGLSMDVVRIAPLAGRTHPDVDEIVADTRKLATMP